MHSYPFLRVASVVASNCNAPYWHLKAVSACKLDEIFVESILVFLYLKSHVLNLRQSPCVSERHPSEDLHEWCAKIAVNLNVSKNSL